MLDPKIYELVFEGRQDGKNVLEELCRVFYDQPSYTRGDPYETAYNEGRRAVMNFILSKILQSKQPEQEEI